MTILDLSNNLIGDIGVKNISRALNGHCLLRTLNLANNKITHKGIKYLFLALRSYSVLKNLVLDGNILDGSKLKSLKEMLECNKGLLVLSLSKCSLGEEGALFIAVGLIRNQVL